tara:strand:- start:289 stop:777 length:489 start_codon:yes stop_codon:yes gene_type:complete
MEYKYKQIKNFLDKKTFNKIKELMLSNTFPWFFHESQTSGKTDSFFMSHNFYHNNRKNSIYYDLIIEPIIKKLNVRVIDEIRANLLFKTKQHIQSEFHVDKDYFCNTAIFYINKNNGYTLLKDKTKIKVEENKLLIIDTKTYHAAVTATDTDRRIVINFNYS